MKRVGLVVLLAACTSSSNDFPTRPSGPGTGTITGPGSSGPTGDAGLGDAGTTDGGVATSARVCLLTDMRKLTTCAARGAGGLTVTLGLPGDKTPATTTTTDDGTFTIAAPLGAGFVWHVTGKALVSSVMLFGTDNTIPVLDSETYGALIGLNHTQGQDEGHGSLVVRVVSGVSPATGITATLAPVADSDTLYDSNDSSDDWNNQRTQSFGVVWVPAVVAPGTETITLSQIDGTTTTTTAALEIESITFVTQNVP